MRLGYHVRNATKGIGKMENTRHTETEDAVRRAREDHIDHAADYNQIAILRLNWECAVWKRRCMYMVTAELAKYHCIPPELKPDPEQRYIEMLDAEIAKLNPYQKESPVKANVNATTTGLHSD